MAPPTTAPLRNRTALAGSRLGPVHHDWYGGRLFGVDSGDNRVNYWNWQPSITGVNPRLQILSGGGLPGSVTDPNRDFELQPLGTGAVITVGPFTVMNALNTLPLFRVKNTGEVIAAGVAGDVPGFTLEHGNLILGEPHSQLIPGTLDFAIRDHLDANSNVLVGNDGLLTLRGRAAAVGAILLRGWLQMDELASRLIPGATSFAIWPHSNTGTPNLLILDSGVTTVNGVATTDSLLLTHGYFVLGEDTSKIKPGTVALILTAHNGTTENVRINEAGSVVIHGVANNLGLELTAGLFNMKELISRFVPGATSLQFRKSGNGATNVTILESGRVGLGDADPLNTLHLICVANADIHATFGVDVAGGTDGLNVGYGGAAFGVGQSFLNAHAATAGNAKLLLLLNGVARLTLDSTGATVVGALTLDAKPKNKFFGGPISGADAVPAFRVLDVADLPALAGFRATSAAATSYTAGNLIQAVFATEIFDTGSDYASNAFTAPRTATYQISTHVTLDNADAAGAGNQVFLAVDVNGTKTYIDEATEAANSKYHSVGGSIPMHLTAGDVVKIYLNSADRTRAQLALAAYNWFGITEVR